MVDPRLYPFGGKYLDLGGRRMHYLDEGQGRPVVMIHGNPTWSFYYRDLIQALRPTHRCLAPDHIGCGLSDKPALGEYDYTLASRVDDITKWLDHAHPAGGVTLVLHDWGGMIGLAWAVRHAARVERLVLMNTAGFHLPAGRPLPRILWPARHTRFGAWLVTRLNAFCRVAARFASVKKLPAAVRSGYLAPYDTPANRVAVLRFVQSIPLEPADEGYDIVSEVQDGLNAFRDTPTQIFWGMRDFVFNRHFLAEWKRRLPHAVVHEFANAGHYVIEDAGEAIVSRVRATSS